MRREIQTALSLGLHEPERLLQSTQQMADANVQQLERLGRIVRGRELRHALQAELTGEKAGASALRAQFATILQGLQHTLAPDAVIVTAPQRSRARHYILLLRLENEAVSRAAVAALADVTTVRDGHRMMDGSMRAAIVVPLARVEARLGMLADYCDKVQSLSAKANPAPNADGRDEDDL